MEESVLINNTFGSGIFLSWSCGPPNMFDVSYQNWRGFGAQMGVVEVDLVAEEACIPSSYL